MMISMFVRPSRRKAIEVTNGMTASNTGWITLHNGGIGGTDTLSIHYEDIKDLEPLVNLLQKLLAQDKGEEVEE